MLSRIEFTQNRMDFFIVRPIQLVSQWIICDMITFIYPVLLLMIFSIELDSTFEGERLGIILIKVNKISDTLLAKSRRLNYPPVLEPGKSST